MGEHHRITMISNMVNNFMNHALVAKGLSLLELQLVAANFKALADNWQPPETR